MSYFQGPHPRKHLSRIACRVTPGLRRTVALLAVAALLVTLPAAVPDAAADHDAYRSGGGLTFAAGIRLGGFHLSIGYQPTRYGQGTYYYRTRDRIHYDHYQCNDQCYRRGGSYYHHERCPVMLHLMHVERIHPHRLFSHHAPRYDHRWTSYDPYAWERRYRGSRYSDRDRHHRWDRWDRYDRRHRRYDDDSDSDRRHRRHRGWKGGRGHGRH